MTYRARVRVITEEIVEVDIDVPVEATSGTKGWEIAADLAKERAPDVPLVEVEGQTVEVIEMAKIPDVIVDSRVPPRRKPRDRGV